jgi:hypothetical protein
MSHQVKLLNSKTLPYPLCMPLKLEHLFAGTDIPDMCHPGRNKFSRIRCNTFAQVNFKNLSKSASKKKSLC